MRTLTVIILLFFSAREIAWSQSEYKISQQSEVNVMGTSTLHDWEMKTKQVTGNAGFQVEGSVIKGLSHLTVSIPAKSLKSEKESMDDNAYKALKTSAHSTISYQMTKLTELKKTGLDWLVTCDGKLTIAGVVQTTSLTATCKMSTDGSIQCKGEKKLDMTEFKVEPPSFMFGSVKTGKTVNLVFDIFFIN